MQQKLRVVFDASCPSDTTSLNDQLLSGPKLQQDLANILSRFRLYLIPIITDIVKMYRQVLVHPEDRKHLHIFWRPDSSEPLVEYELNTVTYGVKDSAYQAIRSVRQHACNEGPKFPLAASRVPNDMHVDDLVTVADSTEQAISLCHELVHFFKLGGFSLGKWCVPPNVALPQGAETSARPVQVKNEGPSFRKVIGLTWNPASDSFSSVN